MSGNYGGDAGNHADAQLYLQEQIQTISLEAENLRTLFLQLDKKVATETGFRERLEADFENRMKSVDWQCYSQELAEACDELQQWRDGIEAERTFFKQSLKKDLEQELEVSEKFDSLRKAVADESNRSAEAVRQLEQQYQDVNQKMLVEAESRGTWNQRVHDILEAEGDERNRILACFSTQRQEIQSLADKLSESALEMEAIKKAFLKMEALNGDINLIPKTALNLEADGKELNGLKEYWQQTYDVLTAEVAKLSGQVKEAPPLLLELTLQLQALQQAMTGETNERHIAIENLGQKVELVTTVFNVEAKQGSMQNVEEMSSQTSQQHEHQLRLIFDQLDALANTQLSGIREQLANTTQQLSMEQAERKTDSEMVWSSMQSLHGHLVQFISQPPAASPPPTGYGMPSSQSRMPRSRSPSPRFPPADSQGQPGRPRPLLPMQLATGPAPVMSSGSQLMNRSLPSQDVTLGHPSIGSPQSYTANVGNGRTPITGPQLSWTQPDMTAGQNISFARHLLKG